MVGCVGRDARLRACERQSSVTSTPSPLLRMHACMHAPVHAHTFGSPALLLEDVSVLLASDARMLRRSAAARRPRPP